jgi:hypothetical protein
MTETQAWIIIVELGIIALVYLLSLFGYAGRGPHRPA